VSVPAIADIMRAYAADAVAYAQEHHGLTLDFSERSLDDVDRIVEARKALVPEPMSKEEEVELWIFSKVCGGYVGETIIRNLGGTWFTQENPNGSTAVKLLAAGQIESSPPVAVWRNLTEPFRSVATYYRTLQTILGHGTTTTENGVEVVKLPPFSTEPPLEAGQ
jgi:hypothetical protein